MPTPFEIMCKPSQYEIDGERFIVIERRSNNTWTVMDGRTVLNRDNEFEYEPMPSSRSDEFLARTRFSSPQDAYEGYLKWKNKQ